MILVHRLPPGQSNVNKIISLLKEMFSEHGIPKVLHSDKGPQYVSVQFADFCICWGISHETSSLHYPQSNRFAKACVKSAKHALQWAKYSGANPHLALLALWAMPINSKLPSPAELLYQCRLRTTIPSKICNSDPSAIHVHEQIDTHSEAAKSQTDKCSKTLAPLYSGQPVATYDTLWKIWVWHPLKDLGSCYCDTHPTMEQLSSMHQQWFHILLHSGTPLWTQCQSSRHCPKWHHCHTTGSVKTPLHSRTTCITPTCTMHAAHICCTCNTGNPDETDPSCSYHASCSEECPSTKVWDIPCHSCAATKIWPWPHGTKIPDPGDQELLTWTVHRHRSCYALLHTSQVDCCSNLPCNIFSERGMLYDHFI